MACPCSSGPPTTPPALGSRFINLGAQGRRITQPSYQRFQNGILIYDATAGTTQALPLGEYLKDILTGQNLPADLASQSATSPLLRAGGLTSTDLTDAFVPDAA